MPINHPAAVLYTPSRMEILKQDFKKIKRLIDSDGEMPACEEDVLNLESETTGDEQNKDEQLELF